MTCSVVAEPSPFIGRLTFTLLEATATSPVLAVFSSPPTLLHEWRSSSTPLSPWRGGWALRLHFTMVKPFPSARGARELVIRVTWQLLVYMMVWKLTHFYSFGTMCACHCAFCPLWKSANEVARPHVGLLPHCFGEPSHRLDLLALRTILPQHIKPLMPLTVSS